MTTEDRSWGHFMRWCRDALRRTLGPSRCSSMRQADKGPSSLQGAPLRTPPSGSPTRFMGATCGPSQRISSVHKPLRVLYKDMVGHGEMPTLRVGRIVMSGSFAQICAELDRMIAMEVS